MAKRKKRTQGRGKPLWKGALVGAGVLIGSVMLLAMLVFLGWLPESAIPVCNTIIKILTALSAGIAVGVSRERAPWYFGGIAALLSLTLSVAGMSLYLGAFRLSWNLLADLFMSVAIGSAAAAALGRRKAE